MNKAVVTNQEWSADGASVGTADPREQLSALVDGQLASDEVNSAIAYASEHEGRAAWELYHLVGDVLRSSDLARPARPNFMARLKDELAKEPGFPSRDESLQDTTVEMIAAPGTSNAANASIFRWKMVAGFASLTAVAAIGWNSLSALQHGPSAGGAQLAQSVQSVPAPSQAPTVAVVEADGQQVMIRDPRLDELLAAHKQFGSTSALQMPAGFLRNATFEAPGR